MFVKVSSSNISIETDCVCVGLIWSLDNIEPVGNHVGMLGSPGEWANLLDSYKASQVLNLCFRIVSIL